jgi:hypothetical protein
VAAAAGSVPVFEGAAWISASTWAYPALEAMHIVGISMLVGSLLLLELRVWGFGVAIPVRDLSRLALSVSVAGFGLAAFSGLLMFASQPGELLANRAFLVKMGVLTVAGTNAALFHARDGLTRLDAVARVQTAASVGLWIAVIILGRWIAYL